MTRAPGTYREHVAGPLRESPRSLGFPALGVKRWRQLPRLRHLRGGSVSLQNLGGFLLARHVSTRCVHFLQQVADGAGQLCTVAVPWVAYVHRREHVFFTAHIRRICSKRCRSIVIGTLTAAPPGACARTDDTRGTPST